MLIRLAVLKRLSNTTLPAAFRVKATCVKEAHSTRRQYAAGVPGRSSGHHQHPALPPAPRAAR
jgi:hypothetical protein